MLVVVGIPGAALSFVIEDFPGLFQDVSRGKLPPGALVDYGAGKDNNRSTNFEISNLGEMVSSRGLSFLAEAVLGSPFVLHSVYEWTPPVGGSYLLIGTHQGISRARPAPLTPGSGVYYTLSFSLLPFSSTYFGTGWLTAWIGGSRIRRGCFVPYKESLYYCDGVSWPLRINSCRDFTVRPMGLYEFNESGPNDAFGIEYSPYEGDEAGTEFKQASRVYFVTLLSRFGESPPYMNSGSFSAASSSAVRFPILTFNWSAIEPHVYAVRIYRLDPSSNTPFFVGQVPRGTASFLDGVSDSDLMYRYPLSQNLGLPSVFKFMEVHDDRMFGVVVAHGDTRVQCSEVGFPDVWPPLNEVPVLGVARGHAVTGLRELGGTLYLFLSDKVLRLRGSDPTTYGWEVVSSSVGCVAPNSLSSWRDGVVFLDRSGLYFFNGSSLTCISEQASGLFRASTLGHLDWSSACGVVHRDQYFLSYCDGREYSSEVYSSDDTPYLNNRVLSINLQNGKVGARDELAFEVSAQLLSGDGIVGLYDIKTNPVTPRHAFYFLSEYEGKDLGVDDGCVLTTDTKVFLAELTCGQDYADVVKHLDFVEVHYECIREVTVIVTAFRSYSWGDADSDDQYYEQVTASPGATPSSTPQWGSSWTGKEYGLSLLRRARASFSKVFGKSFNLGVKVQGGTDQVKVQRVILRFRPESPDWRGSSV